MGAVGLAVLIVVLSMAFATTGVFVGRWLVRRHIGRFHNEVLISLFATAGVIYAVLLGFLVVVVWEAYDAAHRNSAEEAATLIPLYRLTNGMEAKHGAEARQTIRAYTYAVVTDEWPNMGKSEEGSRKARRAIGDLDRQFSRLSANRKEADAQIDSEFLNTKSQIVTDRNKRLLEATDKIPWVMWLGTIGGGMIVMMMSFLIYMEQGWPHAVMASLTASLIGLLLFIMLVLSRPFSGP
jgi:cbb3-type cytochrome oxidase subunit 3